jgi:hypothetical protein
MKQREPTKPSPFTQALRKTEIGPPLHPRLSHYRMSRRSCCNVVAEYIVEFSHSLQLDHPLQLRRSSEFDHGAYGPRARF